MYMYLVCIDILHIPLSLRSLSQWSVGSRCCPWRWWNIQRIQWSILAQVSKPLWGRMDTNVCLYVRVSVHKWMNVIVCLYWIWLYFTLDWLRDRRSRISSSWKNQERKWSWETTWTCQSTGSIHCMLCMCVLYMYVCMYMHWFVVAWHGAAGVAWAAPFFMWIFLWAKTMNYHGLSLGCTGYVFFYGLWITNDKYSLRRGRK